MNKISNKKTLAFLLLFTFIFTVVAYAYSEGAGGSIDPNDEGDVIFKASVSTSLDASELNRIELYHEGRWMNNVLFKYTTVDRNQYYNSLSHNSIEEDAPNGVYTDMIIGEIDYIHPNYQDFVGYDENEYHHDLSYIMCKIIADYNLDRKNKEAAESFNIDLNSYTEICSDNPMFREDLLFLLCPQVEATRGDSIPTIFLDETSNSGIVLKQDKNGLKYKYSFVKQGDRWKVIGKEVSQ